MRRLRLMGREEQMLRETVRRLLSEAGMGDVRVAEPRPAPVPGMGDLRRSDSADSEAARLKQVAVGERERRRIKTMSSLPQGGTAEKVIAGLGFTSDVVGIVLNFFDDGRWWGKPINLFADAFSLTFATMQFSNAIGRYSKVVVDTDLSALTQEEREDVLFVYYFDYMVACCMLALSVTGIGASVADIAENPLGTGLEIFIKSFKWLSFGVSAVDLTSGAGSSALAAGKGIDSGTQAISMRIEEINRWVNGPMFTALVENTKSALAMLEKKSGQAAVAAAISKLVLDGLIPRAQMKACLDEVLPKQRRDEILNWLSTVKAEAALRAK